MSTPAYRRVVPARRKSATNKKQLEKKLEPTPIVDKLLREIDLLRRSRPEPLTQLKMMQRAGGTQQQWSRWNKGAEPGVNMLAAVANVLEADLEVRLVDRRTSRVGRGGTLHQIGASPQSVEATNYIDSLEEPYRIKLVEQIKRLADSHLAAQARERDPRSK